MIETGSMRWKGMRDYEKKRRMEGKKKRKINRKRKMEVKDGTLEGKKKGSTLKTMEWIEAGKAR